MGGRNDRRNLINTHSFPLCWTLAGPYDCTMAKRHRLRKQRMIITGLKREKKEKRLIGTVEASEEGGRAERPTGRG